MYKTFHRVLAVNDYKNIKGLVLKTLEQIKKQTPQVEIVVDYEISTNIKGTENAVPKIESKPFFEYKDLDDEIILTFLYPKDKHNQVILQNEDVNKFLNITNVSLFNTSTNTVENIENKPLVNLISNKEKLNYNIYKTFAVIKIEENYLHNGYYVVLTPRYFPFRQERIYQTIYPLMDKISDSLHTILDKKNNVIFEATNFLDPQKDSFFGSEYVDNFLKNVTSTLLNKIIFYIQLTDLTENEKEYLRTKANTFIIEIIKRNEELIKAVKIAISELQASYKNGRAEYGVLDESPIDKMNKMLVELLNSEELKEKVDELNNKVDIHLSKKYTNQLEKIDVSVADIKQDKDIIDALFKIVNTFKDLLLDTINAEVDAIYNKLENSESFNKYSYLKNFLHIIHASGTYISDQENDESSINKPKENKLFNIPKDETVEEIVNPKQEENINKISESDLTKSVPTAKNELDKDDYTDASNTKKQKFYKAKGIIFDEYGTANMKGEELNEDDLKQLYEKWQNEPKDEESNDDSDDTKEKQQQEVLYNIFKNKAENIKNTSIILQEMSNFLKELKNKYRNHILKINDYKTNILQVLQRVIPVIKIHDIAKVIQSITPKYIEDIKPAFIMIVIDALVRIMVAIENESIDSDGHVKNITVKLQRLTKQLFSILDKASVGGVFFEQNTLDEKSKFNQKYNSNGISDELDDVINQRDTLSNSSNISMQSIIEKLLEKFDMKLTLNINEMKDLDLNTLNGFSNELLRMTNFSELIEKYDLVIDGEIYTYNTAIKDYENKSNYLLKQKFISSINDKEVEKILEDDDTYNKYLMALVKFLYSENVLPVLGIDSTKPRTFHEVSKLLDSLLASNGRRVIEIRDRNMANALYKLTDYTENESLDYIIVRISEIYDKFKELVKE